MIPHRPLLHVLLLLSPLTSQQQAAPAVPATVVPVARHDFHAAGAGWNNGDGWTRQHDDCCALARRGGFDLLLLGDSITQGFGGDGREVHDPGAAARAQRLARWTIGNFGISGDCTQHLLWRIDHGELDGLDPRFVAVMIGTNNITADDPPAAIAQGIAAVVAAVQRRLPHATVVLQAVLPRGATADDQGRRAVAEIDAALPALADHQHVPLLDLTAQFLARDRAARAELFAGDFQHLSAAGYDVWATALAAELQRREPARPRHVVFVTGDEEYRSEESMPMLAAILARDHGTRTTVCLPEDPHGRVDPTVLDHIGGLQALDSADLMVLFTRFRALPDDELRRVLAHTERGRPVVGFRTATHAFRYPAGSPHQDLDDAWPQQLFGQKWLTHHGHFDDGKAALTFVEPLAELTGVLLLRGVRPFRCCSWLYHVDGGGDALPADCRVLVRGTALRSQHEQAPERYPRSQPVAWTRELPRQGGGLQRVFYTSLGHPFDFNEPDCRRLALQGMLWALGREDSIPAAGVAAEPVAPYAPSNSGIGGHRR